MDLKKMRDASFTQEPFFCVIETDMGESNQSEATIAWSYVFRKKEDAIDAVCEMVAEYFRDFSEVYVPPKIERMEPGKFMHSEHYVTITCDLNDRVFQITPCWVI